jgi:hypothetical protein
MVPSFLIPIPFLSIELYPNQVYRYIPSINACMHPPSVVVRRWLVGARARFESKVEIPRIKHGKRQEIESLLNEEALLLARYLRSEKKEWTPRLPSL